MYHALRGNYSYSGRSPHNANLGFNGKTFNSLTFKGEIS